MTTAREFRLILPLLDPAAMTHLLPLATTIAQSHGGFVIALGVVEVPEQQPLNTSTLLVQEMRETLRQSVGDDPAIQTMVRVTRSFHTGLIEAVRETGAELLLLGWSASNVAPERVFGLPLEQLIAAPPCDLVLVKHQPASMPRRILLPTAGGANLQLSSEIATGLAATDGGSVTLLSVADPRHPLAPDARDQLRGLRSLPFVTEWVERPGPALPAIRQEALLHDAVVIGATGRHAGERTIGPLAEALLKYQRSTVIVTCHKLAPIEQHAVDAFESSRDHSAQVDRWFAQNTFSADEFADLERLIALKQRQRLTISLVLPALNEAETIGLLIDALKGPLAEQAALLDEIILIDSHSTDGTREIAAAHGIPVTIHQQVLPQYGAFSGKGEALWKSLFVSRGDLVVWIDTDIRNVHPRFIYGLVGPLLREPQLQFTKGFYRRPIQAGAQMLETGGGRVTELVARPLFNLFYPELSGFIQPLSGEYAGRRAVLERLPFFTGYGVETGLLIDLLDLVGLEGMAQVDLQQRIHRNQPLAGLSRMSFAIMQVVLGRLEARQRLHLLDPVNQSLKLICEAEGGFQLDVRDIRDHERPPITTLPEYNERHRLIEA